MFSTIGTRFRTLPCPRQHDCPLPICIFSHTAQQQLQSADECTEQAPEYDPFSAGDVSPPPAKRRRLSSPSPSIAEQHLRAVANKEPPSHESSSVLTESKASVPQPTVPVAAEQTTTIKGTDQSQLKQISSEQPPSISRTVSPPPVNSSRVPPQVLKKEPQAKAEPLVPRTVSRAPALLNTRLTVLKKLHEQVEMQNVKLAAAGAKWKPLVLSKQELITFVLDEEEAAAKLGDANYKRIMAQTVMELKKLNTDLWITKISRWSGVSSKTETAEKSTDALASLESAGLGSLNEQTAVLRHLRTPLTGLEKYGYVTEAPSAAEIAVTKAALVTAKGFEVCDRCGTRFQVIPGRDEDGRLTTRGSCHYHWARPRRSARTEAFYACCNKPEGSEGCAEAETHVFAVKEAKRLASILQFETTPEQGDHHVMQPVCFDCEMGYTTFGMEVIRVTAVSWPKGELLLDVLVRTYGEVLDLNTRFSGVTQEQYSTAKTYSSSRHDETMQKVESPAAARQLLFNLISPDTPVLGHAIENDLNVLRVIHCFVIDTVLLYPHPRGLPIRHGLKVLAQKHLSRGIQMAGIAGHDSKEDAVATGDLVTQKVIEKWKLMKYDGWRFSGGLLLAPDEVNDADEGGKTML